MGVDPNKIRLTGENSFLRIGEATDGEHTAENSHWRVYLSPKGMGRRFDPGRIAVPPTTSGGSSEGSTGVPTPG